MKYRPYPDSKPMLFGYDPYKVIPPDHLARLVELAVEETELPLEFEARPGQPAFNPRSLLKVSVYGYTTGVRSSRQLAQNCRENLPYLLLTRGDTPSYHTISDFRVRYSHLIELVWLQLFLIADQCGMKRMGRIVIDSSKFRADAGPEAVIKANEFQPVLDELREIFKEASRIDKKDDEDPPGQTTLGQPVDTRNMRDILRRVRKQISAEKRGETATEAPADEDASDKPLGPKMLPRIELAIETLEEALENRDKFACLTDPDARMMPEGREKNIHECHSFEIAVDEDAGLIVVGQSSQSSSDNSRLEPLVTAAKENAPNGVILAVTADSGYYSGAGIVALLKEEIDVCIPDSSTAGDLHRAQPIGTTRSKTTGTIPFVYDAVSDSYSCPEGNHLVFHQVRNVKDQKMTVYKAERDCTGCPLKEVCMTRKTGKRRTMRVSENHEVLQAHLARFSEPDHEDRYHHRGSSVETVFGFTRGVLSFHRWSLRGKVRVACESVLFKAAYQFRKVFVTWRASQV